MSDPRASAGHLASLFVSLEVDSRKTKASCLNRTALIRLPGGSDFCCFKSNTKSAAVLCGPIRSVASPWPKHAKRDASVLRVSHGKQLPLSGSLTSVEADKERY